MAKGRVCFSAVDGLCGRLESAGHFLSCSRGATPPLPDLLFQRTLPESDASLCPSSDSLTLFGLASPASSLCGVGLPSQDCSFVRP